MSEVLITMLLTLCPGSDFDSNGRVITNACQEWMSNCLISEAWPDEPTEKTFNVCSGKHRDKIRRGDKIVSSDHDEE